jgi:phytoene dehydrogenase-like protein
VALAPEAVLRRELVLGVESPLYASLHSGAARLAPEGAHLVHLVRYLGADEAPDPEAVREELTGLLDHMGPNLRQHVRFTRYLPHVTVAHDQPQARRGGLPGRPPVRHGSIAGLYRAGDWVGAEGLLADASVASAIEAARALIADAALRAA